MTDPTDDTPDLARAVEALADEWESDYPSHVAACNRQPDEWWRDLRAVLDKHRPDRATQPTEAALTEGEVDAAVRASAGEPLRVIASREADVWDEGWTTAVSIFTQATTSTPNPYRTQPTAEPMCGCGEPMSIWPHKGDASLAQVEPTAELRTAETDERVEWGCQKRSYPLGEGFRLYGDDEASARAAAPKVIGEGAYPICRTVTVVTTYGPWVPARADDPTGGQR